MVEIGVDQDKITVSGLKFFNFLLIKWPQFGPQHVTARVSGDMNGYSIRQMRILPPEPGIVFTPGKKMRDIFDGPGIKTT